MAFLWAYINIPEIRAGIRLVCKCLEISDCLIHPKPEKIQVLGLVGIRETRQLEQKFVF